MLFNRALAPFEIADLFATGGAGVCYREDPAPVFTAQPASQNGFLSQTVTLSGAAMGVPRPAYQWFFEGLPMENQTDLTLTLTNLTSDQAGRYVLAASNEFGTTQSAPAILSVDYCFPAPDGLVSWWTGDGPALDATGVNHGSLRNGASCVPGLIGQMFKFDGTDDFVQVGARPSLVFTNQFTVETWIYPQGLGVLMGKEGEYLVARLGNGTLQYAVANQDPGWRWYDTGIAVPSNQWSHVAVVFEDGFVLSYLNGMLAHRYRGVGEIGDAVPSQNDFRIAGRQAAASYLKGYLDEPSVYNRALGPAEVQSIYNAGRMGKGPTTDPAPVFAAHPVDVTAWALHSASFTGTALGVPRPDYQWFFEGAAIPGATNGTLVLSDLSTNDAGAYFVVATNTFGSATSALAHLSISYPRFFTNSESFEDGWNGWYADNGVWEVGAPTSGPGQAAAGTMCAATILGGNYPAYTDSRLISPGVTLPTVSGDERVQLRFWQYFHYAEINGQVQISVWNNGAWGSWQTLATPAYGSGGSIGVHGYWWTPTEVDLRPMPAGE